MKLKLLLTMGIFSILILASCHKDDPATPPDNNPSGTKKLKKVASTEAGVVTMYNLTYSNNKFAVLQNG